MAAKSRFVGVRLTPEEQRKLILLSMETSEPGNMSAGLRYALDQIQVSGSISVDVQGRESKAKAEPEGVERG